MAVHLYVLPFEVSREILTADKVERWKESAKLQFHRTAFVNNKIIVSEIEVVHERDQSNHNFGRFKVQALCENQ